MLLNYSSLNLTSADIVALNQFQYDKIYCCFEWNKYLQIVILFLIWLTIMIIYLREKKNIEKIKKTSKIRRIKCMPKLKTPLKSHIWKRFKKRYGSGIKRSYFERKKQ